MKKSMLFLMLWVFSEARCQINFYEHVYPIIEKRCIGCHRPGGLGPFSLTSYIDVVKRTNFIMHVIDIGFMPPWKADKSFQEYRNEQIISKKECDIIRQWINSGMVKGVYKSNTTLTKESQLRKPDVSLSMTLPYKITNQSVEDFRFFVIPTQFETDVFVSSIEFVPGNKKQVHHSRIMVDSTRLIRGIDGLSEFDPRIKEFQTIPLADEFLYGWVPGNTSITFPPGTAKRIKKGSDLILNIHYSPSSNFQLDQSRVNFFYSSHPVNREVKTLTLKEDDIINQPFEIDPERMPTFYMDYELRTDVSLISVMPHMHFIGKSFLSYAITPVGEKIPLIKIDQWDFNWQSTYQFKKLIYLPAGSRILVEATYDNTSENPENPNNPPKFIKYGWNSTDEMCNLVIYYLDYQEGDEELEY